MRFLIDTDWVIHFLNGKPGVVDNVQRLEPEGIGISIVSLAEVYEVIFTSRHHEPDEQHFRNFLTGVTVVNLDEEVTRVFARARGRLRRSGKLIADFDLLIGATALRYNLTLLSNNRRLRANRKFAHPLGLEYAGHDARCYIA